MVDRSEIEAEVRDGIEVLETGRWYIIETEYDGVERAAQSESVQGAVDGLVSRLCEKEMARKERECEREQMEAEMERKRERDEERMERAVEGSERKLERLRESLGGSGRS